MIKTCPTCGKQFETRDKRKKYCSADCARRAKSKQNGSWNKSDREEKRLEWAKEEAEKFYALAIEEDANDMDALVEYIYNNYNKRSK